MPALRHAIRWILLASLCIGPVVSAWAANPIILTEDESTAFANEPQQIRELLEKAVTSERSQQGWQGEWKAAGFYCEASRLGSAEAQYRLGMLRIRQGRTQGPRLGGFTIFDSGFARTFRSAENAGNH